MTEPVDVLAWLDSLHATTAYGAVTNRKWPEAQEARAAVAELFEAARNHIEAYGARYDAFERLGATTDLRAALARCVVAK